MSENGLGSDNRYNFHKNALSSKTHEILAKLKPLLKSLGITRIADVTGLDNIGIPVALSIRPNAKHLSVSQGKGLTWELAQISAIMESVEGYHAENPNPPDIISSYEELKAKNYPLVDLKLLHTSIFDLHPIYQLAIPWIKAMDLVNNAEIYLPHSLVCLDTTQLHPEYSFLSANTNGLAAGNELNEAIAYAIYEIIERDCLFRWWELTDAEKQLTEVNLSSISSTINQHLLAKFAAAQIDVKVWDVTSHVMIPTFRCEISDANVLRGLTSFTGSGTHPLKEIALSRALTEAAQTRLTLITGSRDDVFAEQYQSFGPDVYSSKAATGNKNYDEILDQLVPSSFADHVQQLIQKLTQHNFTHIYMVNHTKPEYQIPVVHVFIPQMLFDGTKM